MLKFEQAIKEAGAMEMYEDTIKTLKTTNIYSINDIDILEDFRETFIIKYLYHHFQCEYESNSATEAIEEINRCIRARIMTIKDKLKQRKRKKKRRDNENV